MKEFYAGLLRYARNDPDNFMSRWEKIIGNDVVRV